jgi:hypothetical protein
MHRGRRPRNWLQRLLIGGSILALAGCAVKTSPGSQPQPGSLTDAARLAIGDARRALVEAEGPARDLWRAELALPLDETRRRAFSEWIGRLSGMALDTMVLIDRNPAVQAASVYQAITRMVDACEGDRARVAAAVSPAHFAALRAALLEARGHVAPSPLTAGRSPGRSDRR